MMLDKVGVMEAQERLYTLDSYPFKEKHREQFEWMKGWAKNPNCDLLIWGMGGQGKTGMSLVFARERMMMGDSVWFQRLYQVRKESASVLFDRVRDGVSVLILDDLPVNLTGWREELAFRLLDLKTRVIVTMSSIPEQKLYLSQEAVQRLSGLVRVHLSGN